MSSKEFWRLVKEMKSMGYDIDMDTYTKLLKNFIRSSKRKDAVELYKLMIDSPYKPPIEDFCKLLGKILFHVTPDLLLTDRVIKKFKEAGNSLTKAENDMIYMSFISAREFVEADKVLKTMRSIGYPPDSTIFSQIVFGLCKAWRAEEACNKMNEMEAQGFLLGPPLEVGALGVVVHLIRFEIALRKNPNVKYKWLKYALEDFKEGKNGKLNVKVTVEMGLDEFIKQFKAKTTM
ncbi:hypothetical protein GIB67_030904 [Kingdonia uniflora]|uniref:Pentatricopeptide repeat-containing protein n=1 Tax=Kingdonia uniflora TaxID=39325 RepID=A0A7J7L3C1_9MAGN|nr:hypothetical protein GIB67_030904 [Kingdonia uniflora]